MADFNIWSVNEGGVNSVVSDFVDAIRTQPTDAESLNRLKTFFAYQLHHDGYEAQRAHVITFMTIYLQSLKHELSARSR